LVFSSVAIQHHVQHHYDQSRHCVMSNPTNSPDSTPAFDLFGVPDEDNLKEQLAKGTFQWTNKYTRILAIVLVLVGCLSAGAVYGHYEATKSSSGGLTTSNFASLRSAFASAGGASALAGASGASGFAGGGFGGGGFSRGTAGTVAKVSGNTVTITLNATPATPIKVGDKVTVRGATAGGAAGGFGGAAGGLTGGTGSSASGSSAGTSAGAPASAGTASGAPRAGGRFSNPAFTACLAKAGVTFTAGTRPDFTDPKVAAAIQSCATSLGLSAPGAPGAGGSGFGSGTGRSAAPATPSPAASPSN
jgi:hypothetical protein